MRLFLFLSCILTAFLMACSSTDPGIVETAAAQLVAVGATQTSIAAEQGEATRQAVLADAVATALLETAAAESVQTSVVSTQEAAFTPTPRPQLTCAEQSKAFIAAASPILGRWSDAAEIASSTSRISLSGPVAELQAIRRDAEELDAPACAAAAKTALLSSMDHLVEAFLLFMKEAGDSQVNQEMNLSASKMEDFSDLLHNIAVQATRTISTRIAATAAAP